MPGAPETGFGRWPDTGTGEVRIRDVIAADLPVFFLHQRDPLALQMAAFPSRNEREFATHWKGILANPHIVKKTIVHDEQVAGNVLCWQQDGRRLVGYWVGREFWGKGFATHALAELVEQMTARPLNAWVATSNLGSIRVLEKCGFVEVGRRAELDEKLGEPVAWLLFELADG